MPSKLIRPFVKSAMFAALALATGVLHAQLPKDNDVWKTRCNLLTSAVAQIGNGSVPPALASATRGVSGPAFTALAFDRSGNGDHQVACSLFAMASIAQRLGNGGKPDADSAQDAAVLAAAEAKEARGESLSISERFKRKKGQMSARNLSSAETTAVIAAASTVPLTNVSAQNTAPKTTRPNNKS